MSKQGNKPGTGKSVLVQPKTKRGRRYLENKAGKLVEDAKRALILSGGSSSQVIKEVLTDISKLKTGDCVKFTKKNADVKPFEAGGEAALEFFCNKSNCSLFALGTHTKKRPHNLVIGRLFDFHLLDACEFGVDSWRSISSYGAAGASQTGNRPGILFAGDKFESVPELKLVRSMLLDFFRGRPLQSLNLTGLDRFMLIAATDPKTVIIRQYFAGMKKSATQVPVVSLTEMGPTLKLTLRRCRFAPIDLEKEAMKMPKPQKKAVKQAADSMDGKVGRIHVPKQDFDGLGAAKLKGFKRSRKADGQDKGTPVKKIKSA